MPQSEKLKLKAEMVTGDREVDDPRVADQKTLARQIYEAYLKNFNMNKAKARSILSGKTSTPVRLLRVRLVSERVQKGNIRGDQRGLLQFPQILQ